MHCLPIIVRLALTSLLLSTTACSLKQNSWPSIELSALPQTESLPQWRTDVEAALEDAREANKPTIIYWGAIWCPPCNHLKSQVFMHREFETDTREWMKIYIDGDSQGAQTWGDRFNVVNYPTVILFTPDGQESQRFYEVLSYKEFKERLKSANDSSLGFEELVQKALVGEATEAEWSTIAMGSREHYQTQDLYDEALLNKLLPIYKRCPRLQTVNCNALGYAIIAAAFETSMHNEIAMAALQEVEWLSLWRKLVADPQLALMFANHFQYVPKSLIARLSLYEEQRDVSEVLPALLATFNRLFQDKEFTAAQRHNAGVALYQLSRAMFPDKGFQDPWFDAWFTLVDQTSSQTEQRLIFPTIAKMLIKENRRDALLPIIRKRFKADPTAWYQLFRMARSAAKEKDYPTAINVMKEAWQVSPGRSTVLQVVSRSAALVAEFPLEFRCSNLREIQERWMSLIKSYPQPLMNRDKLAQETLGRAIADSECRL